MTDFNKEGKCCLCGGNYKNYGNNPFPFFQSDKEARCCTICDRAKVIPARMLMMQIEKERFTGEADADSRKIFQIFDNVKFQTANLLEVLDCINANE